MKSSFIDQSEQEMQISYEKNYSKKLQKYIKNLTYLDDYEIYTDQLKNEIEY